MNRLNHIMPILVLGYSIFLELRGETYYSGGALIAAILMWMMVFAAHMKNNKNP
nr:hypothetical protein [Allomuricauda sp.]